jgi:hypothetical protein
VRGLRRPNTRKRPKRTLERTRSDVGVHINLMLADDVFTAVASVRGDLAQQGNTQRRDTACKGLADALDPAPWAG